MQKSVAFLYTNNKISERETKEIISFTTELRRIKYWAINVLKEIKDLYSENYKTILKKETEDYTNKWKEILHSWIERFMLFKWPYYPRQWRPARPFRTNTQKRCPFHYRGLECKSRKSRNTWSNRQICLGIQNESGQRLIESCQENALVSKHPLPKTQEKTLHMDITR